MGLEAEAVLATISRQHLYRDATQREAERPPGGDRPEGQQEMFDLLVKQYAARAGVMKQLKAEDQMEWVRRMNNIRERVEETVVSELITN